MNETVLKELLEIKAKVESLISILQSENTSVKTSIEEIRKVAVLEEIARLGGSCTPAEISAISLKYGKTPSSTAGYYSGKTPSLESKDGLRRLSKQGESIVAKYREEWGADWLERIPLEMVGNSNAKATEIVF